MAHLTVSDQNFQDEVINSQTPVLVDFWATWCPPCRIIAPIIDELAQEYEGKIKIGKLDVDQSPQSAQNYNVMSIPSILLFKNGQPVKTLVGAQSKETYKRAIEEVIG